MYLYLYMGLAVCVRYQIRFICCLWQYRCRFFPFPATRFIHFLPLQWPKAPFLQLLGFGFPLPALLFLDVKWAGEYTYIYCTYMYLCVCCERAYRLCKPHGSLAARCFRYCLRHCGFRLFCTYQVHRKASPEWFT